MIVNFYTVDVCRMYLFVQYKHVMIFKKRVTANDLC